MKTCISRNDKDEKCGKPVEGKTHYCATHGRIVRKNFEATIKEVGNRNALIAKHKQKNLTPKKTPNKQSDKMKVKNQEYSERVKEWKKENPRCRAMVDPDCTGETRDCHHMKKRGDLLMVEKYWLPVCRACHTWIGDNAEEARNRGLTINHLEPEFQEPHKI